MSERVNSLAVKTSDDAQQTYEIPPHY
jgi:hypothetical protein